MAILNSEPEADAIVERLQATAGRRYFSPIVRYEASVSLARAAALAKGRRTTAELIRASLDLVDELLLRLGAEETAISGAIGATAIDASALYGKIVGHPADLNMGDCFAYACARQLGVPLLYKGRDFAQTDLA